MRTKGFENETTTTLRPNIHFIMKGKARPENETELNYNLTLSVTTDLGASQDKPRRTKTIVVIRDLHIVKIDVCTGSYKDTQNLPEHCRDPPFGPLAALKNSLQTSSKNICANVLYRNVFRIIFFAVGDSIISNGSVCINSTVVTWNMLHTV